MSDFQFYSVINYVKNCWIFSFINCPLKPCCQAKRGTKSLLLGRDGGPSCTVIFRHPGGRGTWLPVSECEIPGCLFGSFLYPTQGDGVVLLWLNFSGIPGCPFSPNQHHPVGETRSSSSRWVEWITKIPT